MDPNDPRAIRSRKALVKGFVELAVEEGFDNLTIRSVTRRANIGYATFFRHMKTLDELLLIVLQEAFQELIELMLQQHTLYDEAVVLYTFVKDNSSLFRLLFNLAPTNTAWQRMIGDSKIFIRSRCEKRSSSYAPLDLSVEHIQETTHRLIIWYLDRLTKYTPEQMASIHHDFVIAGTQSAVSINRSQIPHHSP